MSNPSLKRAAIYARTATMQTRELQPDALTQQVRQCEQYCSEHGYSVAQEHIYQDVASGAEYRNRPQLHTLRMAAHHYEFDLVVIVASDRFSRNPLHIALLLEELQALGIQVESPREHTDTDERFLHLFLDFQVETQRERIKSSTQQGKAGKRESPTLKEDEAAIVRQLIEMGASGSPLSEMAAQFTVEGVIDASRAHEGCDTPLGYIEQTVTPQKHLEGR